MAILKYTQPWVLQWQHAERPSKAELDSTIHMTQSLTGCPMYIEELLWVS